MSERWAVVFVAVGACVFVGACVDKVPHLPRCDRQHLDSANCSGATDAGVGDVRVVDMEGSEVGRADMEGRYDGMGGPDMGRGDAGQDAQVHLDAAVDARVADALPAPDLDMGGSARDMAHALADGGRRDASLPDRGAPRQPVRENPCVRDPAPRWPDVIEHDYTRVLGQGEDRSLPRFAAHCRGTVNQTIDRIDHVVFVGDESFLASGDLFQQGGDSDRSVRRSIVDGIIAETDGGLTAPDEHWFEFDGRPRRPFDLSDHYDIGEEDFTVIGEPGLRIGQADEIVEHAAAAIRAGGHRAAGQDWLVLVSLGQSDLEAIIESCRRAPGDREVLEREVESLTSQLEELVATLVELRVSLNLASVSVLMVDPVDYSLPGETPLCEPWSDLRELRGIDMDELMGRVLDTWMAVAILYGVDVVFSREFLAPHGFGAEEVWINDTGVDRRCLHPNRRGQAEFAQLMLDAIFRRSER